MNRNTINEISKFIMSMKSQEEVCDFLTEMLTEAELSTLSKRWRILDMLSKGVTQRDISSELQVSLCKVTRGSKILKNRNSVITKHLIKEKNYGNKNKQ